MNTGFYNFEEMKERLLELIPVELHDEAKVIINNNIKRHDALTWDFDNWKSKIRKSKKLF